MFQNKFIGRSASTLFLLATSIIMLLVMFNPVIERFQMIDPVARLLIPAIIALTAIITGILAFETPQGKVAVIGGLVLVGLVAIYVLTSMSSWGPVQAKEAVAP